MDYTPSKCECGHKPTLIAGKVFYYKCNACKRESLPFTDPKRALGSWESYIRAEKIIHNKTAKRIAEREKKN